MEFANENIQTENPFVDILMKNLKTLVYNSIIKDEAAADKAETADSISNAETYMACMENRVSLVMFPNIPEDFLREVGLPESTIQGYNSLGHSVAIIPRDSGGMDANKRIINAGDTVIRINDKWFVPTITGTIEDFLDLPTSAENGDIYRVKKAGGVDADNKNIKDGDILIYINTKWYLLGLNLVNTYEDLPQDAKKGDIYIILGYKNGIIHNDAQSIPIQMGNSVIKLEDGWHLVNPHLIDNFLNIPARALEGDLYKVINSGGFDANGKLIPANSHVVRINNKWYILNNHKELENIDVLDSTLVASKNGIYFVAVDDYDRENRRISSGSTVARIVNKTYSIKLRNRVTIESFNNDTLLSNADYFYKVNSSGWTDGNGRNIVEEDIFIKLDRDCYVVSDMYTVASWLNLPNINDLKNGTLYHISDLNINVVKVGSDWYLFNNQYITIDSITEDFLEKETKNTTIQFKNSNWYKVNLNNKRTISSFYDLSLLADKQLCQIKQGGGTDYTGKEIKADDIVVRINKRWYKVTFYKTTSYNDLLNIDAEDGDLYQIAESGTNAIKVGTEWHIVNNMYKTIYSLEGVSSDITDGDIFTVLHNGGIDALGNVIKANDDIIRMDDRWYICNDYYTVYKASNVFKFYDGDTFKVYTDGGTDENNKSIVSGDTIVYIGKKRYLCSKSVKTSVDNFLYLPSPGIMYTITESGGITNGYKTVKAGDTIVLTEDDWEIVNLKVIDSYIYLPNKSSTGSVYFIKNSGTTFRAQLVKKLRPWFLRNFNELNEYYRKITGKPPLNDWGIPMRDYEDQFPEGFEYEGTFVHEIGADACKDLESYGVLDKIKRDFPKAEYLNYLTAGLSSYECRKASDFSILWTPDEYCDELFVREFRRVYNERKEFFIRSVYNSAMELESEHYHSTMQIYLLIMTMVDMLAEVQTHIVKKDLLDKRCVEFIFSMYGVPYYHDIPFKYQKRMCYNLHKLIKYKACTNNFDVIKEVFDADDIDFFKYYLFKVNKKDMDNELIWNGEKVTRCRYNDEYIKIKNDIIDIPKEKDLIIDFPTNNYMENGNQYVLIGDGKPFTYNTYSNNRLTIPFNIIKNYNEIRVIFIYSDIGVIKSDPVVIENFVPTTDEEYHINIDFPITKYISSGNYYHILINGNIFTKEYKDDEHIEILYNDVFPANQSISIQFIHSSSNLITTTQTEYVFDIAKDYSVPTSISRQLPITNFISKGNQLLVAADENIITNYTTNNNTISIPYNSIKAYNTLEINYIYSTTDTRITTADTSVAVAGNYIQIPEPFLDYTTNNWPIFVISNNKLLGKDSYDIINGEFETYPISAISNMNTITFKFFYLNKEPYKYERYEEDYEQTKYLRFAKISMSYLNSVQYLLDQMNWKKYDVVIHKDPWWTGKEYKEDEYNIVRNVILESEYNYLRTKYFAIGKIIEMNTYSNKSSFFYSALFDDIFNETLLNVVIPSISRIHYCNIAHLFIYMLILTRNYYGLDDNITPVSGNYRAVGFNYKASLRKIRNYIISQHFDPEYFKIWDVIIPKTDIADINEFIKIQENNEKIYYYTQYSMINSNDYREYLIWRYIVDNLFTWKYNQNYFKLSNGSLATTYSEFLQEKDIVLYNSMMSITQIQDEDEKVNAIYNIIDDICYVLEEFLGKELSKQVFSDFVGRDTSALLKYIIKIVEFFKSIKIMLREKGEVNIIGTGSSETLTEDNTMIFYDYFDSKNISRKNEYINIDEDIDIRNIDREEESITIKEDCIIIHKINNQEEDITNVD